MNNSVELTAEKMAPGTSRNSTRSGVHHAPRSNNAKGPSPVIPEEFELVDGASDSTESPLTTPGTHIATLDPDPTLDTHTSTSPIANTDSIPSLAAAQAESDPSLVPVASAVNTNSAQTQSTVPENIDPSPASPRLSSSSSRPTINNRHLEPLTLFNVFSCVDGYYINKEFDNTDSKKARNAFFSCFTAPGSVQFFAANHTRLLSYNSTEYKHAIFNHILGDKWESDVHSRIFLTKQASVEDKSFEVLLNTIGAYNSMLVGTASAVDDVGLQGAFYASFTPEFACYLDEKGVKHSAAYGDWLKEVTKHDMHFRKFIQPKIDELNSLHAVATAASASSSRPPLAPAFSHNAPRSGSRPNVPASSRPASSSSSNSFLIPKMAEIRNDPVQLDLYHKGKCCFHCRSFFANHQVHDCTFEATPLEVPYRPLTEADISYASDFFNRFKKSITLNALLKCKASSSVAAVVPVPSSAVDDVDSYIASQSSSRVDNAVAALWGGIPIARTQLNADMYDHSRRRSASWSPHAPRVSSHRCQPSDSDDDYHRGPSPGPSKRARHRSISASRDSRSQRNSPSPAPVAAVIQDIEHDDDITDGVQLPDESGMNTPIRNNVRVPDSHRTVSSDPPFRLPHLFFSARLSGLNVTDPLELDLLLDHGSHLVLIRDDLVRQLGLRRYRLHRPENISLATDSDSSHSSLTLHEYVKVKLEDRSGSWTSRTVFAIIAPSLCSPMILGLPFLSHNKLVIDHDARTVIDKSSGFDLLNPVPSSPVPLPDTRSPKARRIDICKLRLDLIRELKDFHSRNPSLHKSDTVLQVNVASAVKRRLEDLELLARYESLFDGLKSKYADVFSKIPHVDDLPTDITCSIKLKDANLVCGTRQTPKQTPQK
ncbi:hypothetical protein K435DRAFT_869578 [Dendrothele bispora CBS 962.96]|uniref:Uncharacterized protein n=1 Tax=Dendrothele bispora (strain CBS 962.96) TaxID=1314807 RepID=A0A4S8L9G9_DENBC|nr:hypothetical protein K435DRAFT_869578 [Dendrothele bispora CBS 962.96]